MRRGSIVCLCIALGGCGVEAGGDRPREAVEVDSAGVRIVASAGAVVDGGWAVSATPSVTIATDEADGSYAIHWIRGGARLTDGRIVLLSESAGQLLFFDAGGRFLSSASRRGDGPGELRGPFALHRKAGDTLVVGDRRTRRLSWFGEDGSFLRSRLLDPEPIRATLPETHSASFPRPVAPGLVVSEGTSRSRAPVGARTRRPHYFVLTRLEPEASTLLGPFPGWEIFRLSERISRWPFFAARAVLAAGGSPPAVYVGDSGTGEVRVFDSAGRLVRIVRDLQPPSPITQVDVAWERWELLDWGRQSDQLEDFTRLADAMPLPDHKPAFESLFVDSLGVLWAAEYASYRPAPTIHRLYDAAGRRVGAVRLPGRSTILDVGADYLLSLHSDTSYVETVHLYGLERPTTR